jgi:hypothetical protein
MLTPKRYQVDPSRGGGARTGATTHGPATTTPTTTTTTTAPTTGAGASPPPAHGAVADAGRRLVGMTGSGPITATSPQGRELTQTRNQFHSLTDHASTLIRQAREWAQSNPNDPRIRTNLESAARDLSQARGLMQAVRSAYPDQGSLWVKSGNRDTEMWNFSGAATNLDVSERGLRNTALLLDTSSQGIAYAEGLATTAHTPTMPPEGATRTTATAGPRRRH